MIQQQMISTILNSKDYSIITINNIDDSFFSDCKDEFLFIKNHVEKYGNVPDKITFLDEFSDFKIYDVSEKTSYLIDALYEDYNKRALAKTFNKIRTLLNDGKVDDATKLFLTEQDKVVRAKHLDCVDIIKDTSRYERYVEKSRDFSKYYVKTGFKELDEVLGGWDKQEELATIVARNGLGKCLAKGTKVLMADGTTKNVEDVVVGDKVQSLNRVNNVLALHNGTSNGYRIIPTKGEPFVVSANHTMTFMKYKTKWNNSRRMNDFVGFEVVDMKIEDYLKLSQHQKRLYNLYRPSIEYDKKQLKIPPYILGLWLGDGNRRDVTLTTKDDVIVKEWYDFANLNDAKVSKFDGKSKSSSYRIHFGMGQHNWVDDLFKEYDLLNNKHIPIDYLTSDREDRLQLLAGLIDTDGYRSNKSNVYSITQKDYNLINQIAQLCRGLGFLTTITKKYNKKYERFYYSVNISNRLNEIPVRLDYKKITSNGNIKRPYCLYGFNVEPVDFVEYYGFMCDGDERYMLADNTLTHNTWILLKVALSAAEQGLNIGIYSGEMSENKVAYRIDTMISHISNRAMMQGNSTIQNEYKKYIDALPNKIKGSIKVLTPAMINGPATVTALRAFIEKENLDMLCIDQHSLLEDDRKAKNPVDRASNISRDLKNLQVLKKIPIISVSQQNRTTSDNGVNTTQIAQSDRIGQDSTIVLFIEVQDNVLTLSLVKARDGGSGKKLKYHIDYDKGIFDFIPTENDAMNGKKCEDLKQEYEDEEDDIF